MIIPDRFRAAVLTHAYAVYAKSDYPLILAIEGPPGDGKSFQTAHSLRGAGFEVFARSAALLAGRHEADSSENLRELYRSAGEHANLNESWPAILLDDFDLSPAGQDANKRYTVNSQLLVAFLMNLHDNIASCGVGTERRFPIFLTGNNFVGVHRPLMRHGRMNVFTWELTSAERLQVVSAILQQHVPEVAGKDAQRLEERFSKVPVSFFNAAVNDCFGERILRHAIAASEISAKGLQDLVARESRLSLAEIEAALERRLAHEKRDREDYSRIY